MCHHHSTVTNHSYPLLGMWPSSFDKFHFDSPSDLPWKHICSAGSHTNTPHTIHHIPHTTHHRIHTTHHERSRLWGHTPEQRIETIWRRRGISRRMRTLTDRADDFSQKVRRAKHSPTLAPRVDEACVHQSWPDGGR